MLSFTDSELLNALLRSSTRAEKCSPQGDIDLLRSLLSIAASQMRRRPKTLFEAIHTLDLENPHSDFLAWMLDPLGPVENSALLKRIFERVLPRREWMGEPDAVLREESRDVGRVDICIEWPLFRLLIENKVWSVEGEGQVQRYLTGFEITDAEAGHIIYLTPYGVRPKSVEPGHECVTSFSYHDLAGLVGELISDGTPLSIRARVFLEEFRDCIHRLLRVRLNMNKPTLSESTRIFLNNAQRLDLMRNVAVDESKELIEWMADEAGRKLRKTLGDTLVSRTDTWNMTFHLPQWVGQDFRVTICFGSDKGWKEGLLHDFEGEHYVGILILDANGDYLSKQSAGSAAKALADSLRPHWPRADDFEEPDWNCPLWRSFPVPVNGPIDHWIDEVLAFLHELAEATSSGIAKFVEKNPVVRS